MQKLIQFATKYPTQPENVNRIFYSLRWFWTDFNRSSPNADYISLGICDFLVGKKDIDTLEIYIRLFRPGLLIGKGGKCLDYIKEKMEEDLDWKIEFILDEPQTFLI